MADKVKCSQGHENEAGDNFCRFCGEPISGGQIKCPSCGTQNDSGAKFCGKCGKPLRGDRPADLEGMRWQRGFDDFATRVDVEDLSGVLKKGIIVEQGTKALLFINGALAETLQPGRYDLGGLASKLRNFDPYRTGTAILVDAGDVELNLNLTGIYTKDPLNIDVTCKVIAQIENPTFFFNNVMKGRVSYLVSELRSSLYDELQNAFNEAVGKKSVTDLNWDLSLKRQFEVSVENHLRTTFQRNGLNFIQLRTIDYRFKGFDKVRGIQEEVFLLVSEEEAKLQGRKRIFDVFSKGQLQELFEETWKTDLQEKWNELRERMRKNLTIDKMNEIKNAEEMKDFLHEIDKGRILRDEEMEVLIRTYNENKEDHAIGREFMLRKLDLEHELEFERIRLLGKEGLDRDILEKKIEKRRLEVDAELSETKMRAAISREEQINNALALARIEMEKAKSEAEKRKLEVESDRLEMELSLWSLEKVKEVKRNDEYKRMLMQLEKEEKQLEIKLRELEALHKHEIERIQVLSKASVEALISLSGPEQGRMIKELKETETLKDCPEDRILAMAAARSPEVAKAFQEKFKGLSSEELKKLYERMISDKDKMTAETMKMVQEMYNKALETQRDVSVAAAQGRGPMTVYPPTGQSGYYAVPGTPTGPIGAEVIICPRCKTKVLPGQKFCNNCGNEMF